ncbi:keratin-associated protein 5-4-like isoform X1 [Senna tora]|uniref:Keratin-associated protein 5-4-like isoform X1 n=1 Tax=Senna tora TaxID=362788 RepID=A0A834WYF2_9FABA|nr:keratin-associated protein 5-4-like isoform X1 [Senna tora]
MKQKITIKVHMDCSKCRNKALKIAAQVPGVSSVSIDGNEKDRVVVIGEDVDTVCLGRHLKKKFRSVIILSVEEVKPPKPPAPTDQKAGGAAAAKDGKDGKDKQPNYTTLCIVPVDPCCRCHSTKCGGQCGGPCSKCQSHKCHGDCKPCSKCQSHKCHGQCADLRPQPLPWQCQGQCPPWYGCATCYVIKRGPPAPPPWPTAYDYPCGGYRVVYDSNPDGCCIQ